MPGLVLTEFVEPVENEFSPRNAAADSEVAPPSRHTACDGPEDSAVVITRGKRVP
jgi:hypothetical protein